MVWFAYKTPDENELAVKPMNWSGCVQIFNQGLKSYPGLTSKIIRVWKVHRYRPSGALHGLLKVRLFTQDDAAFVQKIKLRVSNCNKFNNLMKYTKFRI